MNMLTAADRGQRIEYIFEQAANQPEIEFDSVAKRGIDVDSFIAGARGYLSTNAKQPAVVGAPYIVNDETMPLEFNAAIRITGERSGTVFFSASRAMLTIILMRMGATDITTQSMHALLRDLADGMVATARRDIGGAYLVWEPSVVTVRSALIESHRVRPLVVPIHWRKFTAQLWFCVE